MLPSSCKVPGTYLSSLSIDQWGEMCASLVTGDHQLLIHHTAVLLITGTKYIGNMDGSHIPYVFMSWIEGMLLELYSSHRDTHESGAIYDSTSKFHVQCDIHDGCKPYLTTRFALAAFLAHRQLNNRVD